MAKDVARSAYMTVISVDPGAVSALPQKTLTLAAQYAKGTGRPIYDLSAFTGAPKSVAAPTRSATSPRAPRAPR